MQKMVVFNDIESRDAQRIPCQRKHLSGIA
jgi:hypothetical protein